ncbi:MAG: signal peptidase I [Planctomycetes bacterium]|nr:signal peptidase I [Planctomycetota bacterium]
MTASGTDTTFDREAAVEAPPEPIVATTSLPPVPDVFPFERERAADRSFGRRFLRDLGRGVVAVVLLHLFVVQISVVRGSSMQPSLVDGDRLIVDRIAYSMVDVDRYDVVVMRNPRDTSVDYVKRVVGLPGERISLQRGRLFVDGEEVETPIDLIRDSTSMPEIIVPDGHFFVLGDNRPVSCDSREFGLVQHELIKGKVRVRFWPLTRLALF